MPVTCVAISVVVMPLQVAHASLDEKEKTEARLKRQQFDYKAARCMPPRLKATRSLEIARLLLALWLLCTCPAVCACGEALAER